MSEHRNSLSRASVMMDQAQVELLLAALAAHAQTVEISRLIEFTYAKLATARTRITGKPTSVRIPEDFFNELKRWENQRGLSRIPNLGQV